MKYARVAVDIVHKSLDQLFDYAVPERFTVRPGSKVIVPFRNRTVEGYVMSVSDETDQPSVKQLAPPKSGQVEAPSEMMELAEWMAGHYLCLRIEAVKLMFPPGNIPLAPGIKLSGRVVEDPVAAIDELRRSPVRLKLVEWLLGQDCPGPFPLSAAINSSNTSEGAVSSLVKAGFVERAYVIRNASSESTTARLKDIKLTQAQESALDAIKESGGRSAGILLHGVTGSGKTEVYIRALKDVVAQGKQGILLVPDIALTPQVSDIVRAHFKDRVAVLHSGLSDSERSYHWYMASKGMVDVVVGARSAVFAPLPRLGMIIMDEEHDSSYKQDESPRYHAREVAQERARISRATLLMGTATPSLETYSKVESGSVVLCELPERVDGRPMPEMIIVDRREEMKAGNYSFLSRRLRTEMEAALLRNGRVMLFLNRRGHSPLILCRDCGYTMKCPDCDVSLVYHTDTHSAVCHYCSHEEKVPAKCPSCLGSRLKMYGLGTQKVEEELLAQFPGAGIGRMDVDSTRKKGSHRKILQSFKDGETKILVGTQMIAKGLDIPEVTLVGVLAADMALKFPDFRAAERTYQLVAQVSGRAGRGLEPGKVVVQSYNPEHYSLKAALSGDYKKFFEIEAASRKSLGYPPFAEMARVLVISESDEAAEECSEGIASRISKADGRIRLLGPSRAPLSRLEGRSRWHILLLSEDAQALREGLRFIARGEDFGGCSVRLDFSPQSTL